MNSDPKHPYKGQYIFDSEKHQSTVKFDVFRLLVIIGCIALVIIFLVIVAWLILSVLQVIGQA